MSTIEGAEDARSRLNTVPAPTIGNKLKRFAWISVAATLYRWSPVPAHAWRRFLLRLFATKVGSHAHCYPSAKIWAPWNLELGPGSCLGPNVICYSATRIALGRNAIVSQGAHLCSATHDYRDPKFPLVVGQIKIGLNAWIGAEAFVGPGVVISAHAVVGARAVVVKDIPPGTVVAGNPARAIGLRDSVER
jgi:putative colanic acid biosynthesis acetyltransferase WcaF